MRPSLAWVFVAATAGVAAPGRAGERVAVDPPPAWVQPLAFDETATPGEADDPGSPWRIVVVSILGALIWTGYVKLSVRVRRTFVR